MSPPHEKPGTPIVIIRRKGGRHATHHGGAWKVAFADFMTAMFTLFLVLWLVNQSSDVKSAIAGYFQDPLGRADEFGSSIIPGDGTQAASVRPLEPSDVLQMRKDKLLQTAERMKEAIEQSSALAGVKNNIEISLTPEGLRIELIEDSTGTFFKSGSGSLSDRGSAVLTLLGTELGALESPVHIEGHTDGLPFQIGDHYGNWELSVDRANTARRILSHNGLRPTQVTQIRGLADRDPRDRANPNSPRNRRITISVLLAPSAEEMIAAGMSDPLALPHVPGLGSNRAPAAARPAAGDPAHGAGATKAPR